MSGSTTRIRGLVPMHCSRCGRGCYDVRCEYGEQVCITCLVAQRDEARAELAALRARWDARESGITAHACGCTRSEESR